MLILASTSAYRKAQLKALGLPFETEASGVFEEGLEAEARAGRLAPENLAALLAQRKAQAVFTQRGGVVIGADQVGFLPSEGVILTKPGSKQGAVAQLRMMSGKTHHLFSAVSVVSEAGVQTHVDRTELTMRPLDASAIERYVELDHPIDCAGSYKFERAGVALFCSIKTEDPSAMTGLPIIALLRLLSQAGLSFP